jgi:hypothetical protein
MWNDLMPAAVACLPLLLGASSSHFADPIDFRGFLPC